MDHRDEIGNDLESRSVDKSSINYKRVAKGLWDFVSLPPIRNMLSRAKKSYVGECNRKVFFERLPDDERYKLKLSSGLKNRDHEFDAIEHIPNYVFSDHVGYIYPKDLNLLQKINQLRVTQLQEGDFSVAFHSEPNFRADWRFEGDASYKKLFKEFSKDNNLLTENNVFLIDGEIGSGKSTLISNLCFLSNNSNGPYGTKNKIVIEDLEVIARKAEQESRVFNVDAVLNAIGERIISNEKIKSSELKGKDLFCYSVEVLKEKGNVTIVFENMDYLYHKYDVALFSNSGWEKQLGEYYKVIGDLITIVKSDMRVKDLCVNICFVARSDTIAFVYNNDRSSLGSKYQFPSGKHFSLSPPTKDWLSEVLNRRFEMLIYYGKKAPFEDEEQLKLFITSVKLYKALVERQIRKENGTIGVLIESSVHGVRHILNLFRDLSPMLKDSKLANRYVKRGSNLELTFLLDGRGNYSQPMTGITNIFLVNVDYRKDGIGDKFPEELLKDHEHTYWLKYLIFMYIANYEGNVTEEKILSVFSCKGYNESIVKLTLASLTEVAHGKLIEKYYTVDKSKSIIPGTIRLSRRGQCIYERELFWDFLYLQLVIEDNWLEYHSNHISDFYLKTDYLYLIEKDEDEYDELQINIISIKSKQVVIFLDILESSLKYEKEIYPEVFERLGECSDVDFENIRKKLSNQIDSLTRHVRVHDAKGLIIDSLHYFNSDERIESISKIDSDLKNSYEIGRLSKFKRRIRASS